MRMCIFFVFFAINSFAGDKPALTVQAVKPGQNLEAFQGMDAQVRDVDQLKRSPTILPKREFREECFTRAGLVDEIKSMDELDRDFLWLKAKRLPASELIAAFPKISKTKLETLKKVIHE